VPEFTYRAMDPSGRAVRGNMTAVNLDDLEARLERLSLDLISARSVGSRTLAALLNKPVRAPDLVQFCVHMDQLLRAGVPLIDCLEDIRESTDQGRFRDTVSALHADVREGAMLSVALSRHPKIFNDVFIGLVRTGEETGNLATSFGELARHIRWHDELARRVRKALRYPIILGLLLLIVVGLMMGYVVPSVVAYLREIDMELPLITRALIGLSDFVMVAWPYLILIPTVTLVGATAASRLSPRVALMFDRLKLRVPIVGPVLRKLALSRFTHFFSILYRGGVPILTCLRSARGVVGNRALSAAVTEVMQRVSDGHSLADSLASSGAFPSLIVRMVRVGEETGDLMETLENVTYYYDREVNDAVDNMLASLEPIITIILGVLMMWIAVAVLGPIYDSFSTLS
jgi:type IV pilus assembly protein PilC